MRGRLLIGLMVFLMGLVGMPCQAGRYSYSDHSVLASGRWTKIRVAESGLCRLSYDQLRQMGFSKPSEVRVFGYGGALIEVDFSKEGRVDDLQEVASYDTGNGLIFYAQGPVKWSYNPSSQRTSFNFTVNTYSNYGYYFLTEDRGEGKRITVRDAALPDVEERLHISSYLDYKMHKKEEFNYISSGSVWYGDKFFNSFSVPFSFSNVDFSRELSVGVSMAASSLRSTQALVSVSSCDEGLSKVINFALSSGHLKATTGSALLNGAIDRNSFSVRIDYSPSLASDYASVERVVVNLYRNLVMDEGSLFFRNPATLDNTDAGAVFYVSNVSPSVQVWDITDPSDAFALPLSRSDDVVAFEVAPSSSLREYVAVDLSSPKCVAAEYVGTVRNQDLHALRNVDYVIVSHPNFLTQAERLARLHEERDGLSTVVVTPEQIYNEFSSGTPDASAIRWFMKMLYDREGGGKYLLLFGDGSFDNRALLVTNSLSINNFIPTYQGGSTVDESSSFVTDDFFALLDDDDFVEGRIGDAKMDIGVGRFPVSSIEQATAMVDKVVAYMDDTEKGTWKNRVCLLADDNEASTSVNKFFGYSDKLASIIRDGERSMEVKKIYLDAYTRITGSNGNRYPEVENLLSEEIEDGVMLLNYVGHSSMIGWTAEHVFTQLKAQTLYNKRRGFWFTASCEFSMFDALTTSGGEDLVMNPNGGAIAIYSAARVVYDDKNDKLNRAFLEAAFQRDEEGRPLRFGDICRLSKQNLPNDSNKMSYMLLGDPALRLAYPDNRVLTDSITYMEGGVTDSVCALSEMRVWGHVEDMSSNLLSDFNGSLHVTLYDKEVVCYTKANLYTEEEDIINNRYSYKDRTNVLFSGEAEVVDGRFSFVFRVPKDINYSYGQGRISYYAYDAQSQLEAQGYDESFVVGGSAENVRYEEQGPDVRLYLNHSSFLSGDKVGASAVLYAFVEDESGINASGCGVGHDITLTLSGSSDQVVLNKYFSYSFNSYTKGSVVYRLPELEDGRYTLTFKVWDLLNNSSTRQIEFVVDNSKPVCVPELFAYPTPAVDDVTVVAMVDAPQTVLSYYVRVYDVNGALMFESGEQEGRASEHIDYTWDLRTGAGSRVKPGFYLVRVDIETEDGKFMGNTKKIMVLPQ